MVFPRSEHSVDDSGLAHLVLVRMRLIRRCTPVQRETRMRERASARFFAPSLCLSCTGPGCPLPSGSLFFHVLFLPFSRSSFCRACTRGPPARSRQFTISKHKQKYEWLQVAWDAVATGLAGSKRWGRDFWDAKRLAWQSLSVSLRSRILVSTPGPTETDEGACML